MFTRIEQKFLVAQLSTTDVYTITSQ